MLVRFVTAGIMGDFLKNDHGLMAGDDLLSIDDLARILHKSPASIRSDICRNLESLPPVCRLPGTKRLLWRRSDVSEWIAKFVQLRPVSKVPSETLRRRGRPRKVAQLA
jgi:hypothetical protein